MNLVELAERKQLPEFQYTDWQTLDWICANKPPLRSWEYRKELFSCPLPKAGSPLAGEWFLEPKTIDGIHGTRHAIRVSIYAHALAMELGLPEATRKAAMLAGLLHDVRRKDDKGDAGHGSRCAEWFRDNHPRISLARNLTDAQRSAVGTAIGFHELSYDRIVGTPEYAGCEDVVDVLKTADALDRYRMPKLTWRIDDAFLKVKPSDEFKAFAFDLVIASEKHFLDGDENTIAIARAFEQLIP